MRKGLTGIVAGLALVWTAFPVSAVLASSPPPADCSSVIDSAQTTGTGALTAALSQDFTNAQVGAGGANITYSFTVTSGRQSALQPPGGPTFTRLEDCAYAGGNPANVKYGAETLNPKFMNGNVIATLTVAATDLVCHRLTVVGTSAAGTPFQDFSNQVGVGAGVANAAACGTPPARSGPAASSGPPADCASVLATPQSRDNTGAPLITKTFTTAVKNGSTITYFYNIHSVRQLNGQPPGGPTYTNIEDCAYIASNPSMIKYGTQSTNPPFQNGDVTVTITADAVDTICDRVVVDGNPGAFTDYTNLVGVGPTSGPGGNPGVDPNACAAGAVVPDILQPWQAPVIGLAILVSVEAVRRRRRHSIA